MSEKDFLIPVTGIDRLGNKIIKQDTGDLNNKISKVDKVNIYKAPHPVKRTKGMFIKINHTLVLKANLNIFQKTGIRQIQTTFSNYNTIKLKISNRKLTIKIV